MSPKQIHSISSPRKSFHLSLKPAPAWMAILGFVLFSALCILVHAGNILRVAFPAGSFALGVFLYWRYPILYLGFTWWLWFLTPWVRRLVDYQSGWVDPSPVLLAPFLATLVTLATFLRHLPRSYRMGGLPFVLSGIGVFYGFLVGLIYNPINAVLVETLAWISPILMSFHLFANWQDYPQYRQNIQRTFCWAVLFMGAYGVLQYMVAPEWDRFWLTNVIKTGNTSFGLPEPLGIRVFSTMNSPGPFAIVMSAGLLLLFSSQGNLRFFAAGVGYLAFLLSLVRSAWLGWFLGLLIFGTSLKANLQMRLIINVLVVGMCIFPLTTVEPFSEVINSRIQTLSSISEDGSYQARTETYNSVLSDALSQPFGHGFAQTTNEGTLIGYDSAIINIFLALGWLGAIPYLGGLVLLLFKLPQCVERRFDPFISSALAISLGVLAQAVGGSVLIEVQGVIFWSFLSIVLAAHKYYLHQRLNLKIN